MIYRNWEHSWTEGNHGFTSGNIDLAKETWDDFEESLTASRCHYKEAYIQLMLEQTSQRSDMLHAMLKYIKKHMKEDAPKFFRWWLDQKITGDGE